MAESRSSVKLWQRFLKRGFDLVFVVIGLLGVGWLVLLCWIAATVDTRRNGFLRQERVGRGGRVFRIFKIRTMRDVAGLATSVTTRNDDRITWFGAALRRWKLDELPQLVNVLLGHMSFVGPRPDVAGFADRLTGADRIILSVRPGITGPATLAFRDEEDLLARSSDPETFNRDVIYPAKVRINRRYVENYSFGKDLLFIAATVVPGLEGRIAPFLEIDSDDPTGKTPRATGGAKLAAHNARLLGERLSTTSGRGEL